MGMSESGIVVELWGFIRVYFSDVDSATDFLMSLFEKIVRMSQGELREYLSRISSESSGQMYR